jgi:hypothetical protein
LLRFRGETANPGDKLIGKSSCSGRRISIGDVVMLENFASKDEFEVDRSKG